MDVYNFDSIPEANVDSAYSDRGDLGYTADDLSKLVAYSHFEVSAYFVNLGSYTYAVKENGELVGFGELNVVDDSYPDLYSIISDALLGYNTARTMQVKMAAAAARSAPSLDSLIQTLGNGYPVKFDDVLLKNGLTLRLDNPSRTVTILDYNPAEGDGDVLLTWTYQLRTVDDLRKLHQVLNYIQQKAAENWKSLVEKYGIEDTILPLKLSGLDDFTDFATAHGDDVAKAYRFNGLRHTWGDGKETVFGEFTIAGNHYTTQHEVLEGRDTDLDFAMLDLIHHVFEGCSVEKAIQQFAEVDVMMRVYRTTPAEWIQDFETSVCLCGFEFRPHGEKIIHTESGTDFPMDSWNLLANVLEAAAFCRARHAAH